MDAIDRSTFDTVCMTLDKPDGRAGRALDEDEHLMA